MIEDARNAREAAEQCLEVLDFEPKPHVPAEFMKALRANATHADTEDDGFKTEAGMRLANRTWMLARHVRNPDPRDVLKTTAVLDELDALLAAADDATAFVRTLLEEVAHGRKDRMGRASLLVRSLSDRKVFDLIEPGRPAIR